METTLAYSGDNIISNISSYENIVTNATEEERPYEIPNCPANTLLQVLYYYPDSTIERFFYLPADQILIRYVYSLVIAIGLITNSAFLWTLLRVGEMRTTTNFYLANLAVADLLLIVCKGVNIFYKFIWSPDITRLVPWQTPSACASITTVTYAGLFGSMSIVTLVSIERFLAICHPLKHRMINDRAHTVKMVSGAWLIAITFAVLVAPNWGKLYRFCIVWPEKYAHRLPILSSLCGPIIDEWQHIVSLFEFIPYFLSMCLNTVLYTLIILRLSKRNISDGGGDKEKNDQATQVRNAVARMLVLNGIIFFVCLTPYQFSQIYYFTVRIRGAYYFNDNNIRMFGYVARVLDMVNSSVNPIIYSVTNVRYRQAFFKAMCCRSQKTHKRANII